MSDERSLLNEPEPVAETAAQAFARLDGRIAVMSRAVEHLAAERASIDIPDYSATLGQMNTQLAVIGQGLAGIAKKPAMMLTPEGMATRMDAAAEQSRRTDSATLREAREGHREAARIIRDLVGALREKQEQRMRLLWTACGGLFAGCLLWSFLPGVVARTLPEGLHLPERMAQAHLIIGRAGASTIAELTVLGRPAILVPLPGALDADQRNNAQVMEVGGGGWIMEQAQISPLSLANRLTELIGDPKRLRAAAAAAKGLGQPRAVEHLADLAEALASRGNSA